MNVNAHNSQPRVASGKATVKPFSNTSTVDLRCVDTGIVGHFYVG
jgi:hypothetical protein